MVQTQTDSMSTDIELQDANRGLEDTPRKPIDCFPTIRLCTYIVFAFTRPVSIRKINKGKIIKQLSTVYPLNVNQCLSSLCVHDCIFIYKMFTLRKDNVIFKQELSI